MHARAAVVAKQAFPRHRESVEDVQTDLQDTGIAQFCRIRSTQYSVLSTQYPVHSTPVPSTQYTVLSSQ